MKKLLVIFVLLLVVVGVVGLSARRKSDRPAETRDTTTVVSVDGEENSEPLSVSAAATSDSGDLKMTSLSSSPFETNKPYHLVRGTAPKGAHAIEVNGYRLRKFMPGQTTWRYIASTYINTLKSGTNDYAVRALDSSGQEMATTDFTIVFNPAAPSLPGVGSPLWIVILMTGLGAIEFHRRRFLIH